MLLCFAAAAAAAAAAAGGGGGGGVVVVVVVVVVAFWPLECRDLLQPGTESLRQSPTESSAEGTDPKKIASGTAVKQHHWIVACAM